MIPKTLLKGFAKTKRAYNKGTLKTGIWNSVKPNGLDYAIAGATVGFGMNDSIEDRDEGFISKVGSGIADGAFGLAASMAIGGAFRGANGMLNMGKSLHRDYANAKKMVRAGVKAADK